MSEFKVGVSPLTNRIYAGKVLKSGIWGPVKHDVTDDALGSVAAHLLVAKQKLEFEFQGKKYNNRICPF